MKIKVPTEYKKYLKLVEEMNDLYAEGFISESVAPDMIEVEDALYQHVLYELGINQKDNFLYDDNKIEFYKQQIKDAKKRKRAYERKHGI